MTPKKECAAGKIGLLSVESTVLAGCLATEARLETLTLSDNPALSWAVFGVTALFGASIGAYYKYRYATAREGYDIKGTQTAQIDTYKNRYTKAAFFTFMSLWLLYEGADAVMAGLSKGLMITIGITVGKMLKATMMELPVVLWGGGQDVRYRHNKLMAWAGVIGREIASTLICYLHATSFLALVQMVCFAAGNVLQSASPLGVTILVIGGLFGLAGMYITKHNDFQEAKSEESPGYNCDSDSRAKFVMHKIYNCFNAIYTLFNKYILLNLFQKYGTIPAVLMNTVGLGSMYAVAALTGIHMLVTGKMAATASIVLFSAGPVGLGLAAGIAVIALTFAVAAYMSHAKMNNIKSYNEGRDLKSSTGTESGFFTAVSYQVGGEEKPGQLAPTTGSVSRI